MMNRVEKIIKLFRKLGDVYIEKGKNCENIELAERYQGRAFAYLTAADILEAEFAVEMKEGES